MDVAIPSAAGECCVDFSGRGPKCTHKQRSGRVEHLQPRLVVEPCCYLDYLAQTVQSSLSENLESGTVPQLM
ncbi:hypothetical protein Nmel_006844 [Mimus melanotis]